MELKTQLHAEEGRQEVTITREFDLPVELLFKAHAEADIFEQWMSHDYGTTKMTIFEPRKNGCYRFETKDLQGNVLYSAGGTFHEFVANEKITRTFEAESAYFDVQLEFLEFEKLTERTSKLTMKSVYRSLELRDQHLKLPFRQGLNMAHDRLQSVLEKLNF